VGFCPGPDKIEPQEENSMGPGQAHLKTLCNRQKHARKGQRPKGEDADIDRRKTTGRKKGPEVKLKKEGDNRNDAYQKERSLGRTPNMKARLRMDKKHPLHQESKILIQIIIQTIASRSGTNKKRLK